MLGNRGIARWLVVLMTLFCALSAARAQEDADDMARHHFEAGRTYFERAQYADAHREFAEAYRLSGRPTLLLNMSRAREAGGDAGGAAADLSTWIAQAPADDPSLEDAQKRLSRLKAQAAVESARRQPAAEPTAPVPSIQTRAAGSDATRDRRRRRLAYGLLGAGGASAVAGGVLAALGRADIRAVESPSAGASWQSVEEEYDRGPRRLGTGIALLSVGALSLATAGVLLLWRKPSRERPVGLVLRAALVGGRF